MYKIKNFQVSVSEEFEKWRAIRASVGDMLAWLAWVACLRGWCGWRAYVGGVLAWVAWAACLRGWRASVSGMLGSVLVCVAWVAC